MPAAIECGRETPPTVIEAGAALRLPLATELSVTVEALARRGARRILVDVAAVDEIDAAGVGELVRAFNVMNTAGGTFQISGATDRVGRVLQVTGLFTLLTGGARLQRPPSTGGRCVLTGS